MLRPDYKAVRRREFIAGLGGAAAWPLASQAQRRDRMRRIGVLIGFAEDDRDGKTRITAFVQHLARLGWIDGNNVKLDYRYAAESRGEANDYGAEAPSAKELVDLNPDVILAVGTRSVEALRQATRSISIVFTLVADPVGGGFIASLARPAGDVTGFHADRAAGGRQIAPITQGGGTRDQAGYILYNAEITYAMAFFRYAEMAAAGYPVKLILVPVRNVGEIESALADLAREPNSGLLVLADDFTWVYGEQMIALATRRQLPASFQLATVCRGRRAHLLCECLVRGVSRSLGLCRSHSQGREAGRPSRASPGTV